MPTHSHSEDEDCSLTHEEEDLEAEFPFNEFSEAVREEMAGEDTSSLKTKLIVVILLTLLIAIAQIVSGIFANSLAILSDALHKFIDITGLVLVYVGFKIVEKKPTFKYTFGFTRIESIVSLVNIVSIWALGIWLLWESIDKLLHKHYDVNAKIMVLISSFSLALDIFMTFMLHSYDIQKMLNEFSTHSCNHDHDNGHSMNYRAIVLHIIADILHSFGILVASILMYYKSDFKYLDSLLTLIFSILILFSTRKLMKQVYEILMESTPPNIRIRKLIDEMEKVEGVEKVNDIHVWSMTTRINVLTAKLSASGNSEIILKECKSKMASYNIVYSTIEISKN